MDDINIYKDDIEISDFSMDEELDLSRFCENDSMTQSIHFNPCELCKTASLDPIDISRSETRLLRTRVVLRNVCYGREITVGCIVINKYGKVLAFKADTFVASRDKYTSSSDDGLVYDKGCCGHGRSCGTVRRTFDFLLPQHDLCESLDSRVRVVANYTSPCSS